MSVPDPLGIPFQSREGREEGATSFSCPLCGGRFSHGTLVCQSCPLNAGCEIVKCPSCGYQFPRRSRLVTWAQKLIRVARG
jgi:hypothetical protein